MLPLSAVVPCSERKVSALGWYWHTRGRTLMEQLQQELPIFQLLARLVFSSCLGLRFGCTHTYATHASGRNKQLGEMGEPTYLVRQQCGLVANKVTV